MAKLERLPLNSPDWDDREIFDCSVGANVLIREIQNSPPGDRDDLIQEFLDWTMHDTPDTAFNYGSPYLVDILTEDVGAYWTAMVAYAQTIVIAMNGNLLGRKQVTQDKYRISKLMVDGLELLDMKAEGADHEDCFHSLIGCIASVQGSESLGWRIRNYDFGTT